MKQKPIIGIYKITSPSGKIYIGKSININKRFRDYLKLFCKSQSRLYNSFLKHGVENHIFEIICECDKDELNKLEIYYIKIFDSFATENGLNLKDGGQGGSMSEETKKKIGLAQMGDKNHRYGKPTSEEAKKKTSERFKGKKHTIEQIEKARNARMLVGYDIKESTRILMSLAKIGKYDGENNPNYGKTASDETRKKQSEKAKKRKGEKHPMFNKKHSLEARQKQRNAKLGRKLKIESIIKREETKKRIRQERLTMIF